MRRKPPLLRILKGTLYAKEQDIFTQEDGDSSNFTRRMPDQRMNVGREHIKASSNLLTLRGDRAKKKKDSWKAAKRTILLPEFTKHLTT